MPDLVSASDIGSWEFCSVAWEHQERGTKRDRDSKRRLRRGTRAHHRHGKKADLARSFRKAAIALFLLLLAALAVLFLGGFVPIPPPQEREIPLGVTALLALGAVAVLLYALSQKMADSTGIPISAKILASDTQQGRAETIEDRKLGLIGNPDYITEEDGLIVAGEAKPERTSKRLYSSDEMQAVTYWLLLATKHGNRMARYARVVYAEASFVVEITQKRIDKCLGIAEKIRDARQSGRPVRRNHRSKARCANCPFRKHCSQSLA